MEKEDLYPAPFASLTLAGSRFAKRKEKRNKKKEERMEKEDLYPAPFASLTLAGSRFARKERR